jgi:hypothetical protein
LTHTATVALILFVFAVTSGSVEGWKTAKVIVNIILAAILAAIFFIWEARLPEVLAAVYVSHSLASIKISLKKQQVPHQFGGLRISLFSFSSPYNHLCGGHPYSCSSHGIIKKSLGGQPLGLQSGCMSQIENPDSC